MAGLVVQILGGIVMAVMLYLLAAAAIGTFAEHRRRHR
jgi:hypothetical protein